MSTCSTTFGGSSALVFGTGAFIASVSLTLTPVVENSRFAGTERRAGAETRTAFDVLNVESEARGLTQK
jgi:hypothetical protein